jgi:hypothetical protein
MLQFTPPYRQDSSLESHSIVNNQASLAAVELTAPSCPKFPVSILYILHGRAPLFTTRFRAVADHNREGNGAADEGCSTSLGPTDSAGDSDNDNTSYTPKDNDSSRRTELRNNMG